MPTNRKRKVPPAEPTPDALSRAQAGFFNTKIVLKASPQPLQASVAQESELLDVLKALSKELSDSNHMLKVLLKEFSKSNDVSKALLKESSDSNKLERLKQKRDIEQKANEIVLAKKAKNEDEEHFAGLRPTMYS